MESMTRTPTEMAVSQYILDAMNYRLEQRFADGRVDVLATGPGSGKYISPLMLAAFKRK